MKVPFSPLTHEKSGRGTRSLPIMAVALSALLFAPGVGLVRSDDASAASCSALKMFFTGQSCLVQKPAVQPVNPLTTTLTVREVQDITAYAPVVSTDSAASSSTDPSSTSASVKVQAKAVQDSAGGMLFDPAGADPTLVKADPAPAAAPAASTGTTTEAAESIDVRLRATAANGQSQLVVSPGCGSFRSGGQADCAFQQALATQISAASIGTPTAPGSPTPQGIPGSHVSLSGSVALSGTISAAGQTISVDRGVSVNQDVGVAATTAPGMSSGFGFGNAMSSASSVGSGTADASGQGYGDSLSETSSSMADAVSGAANDSLGGGVGMGAGMGASASVD